MVLAVCGSPAAGKTTIARAVAAELRLLLLSRDELASGIRLGGSTTDPDDIRAAAERALVDTARTLVGAGVSFVLESSVLDDRHLAPLADHGARVVVIHVVAPPELVDRRLEQRIAAGDHSMRRLLDQHRSGEMVPTLFAPWPHAQSTVTVDSSTSAAMDSDVRRVVEALDRLPEAPSAESVEDGG